LELLAVIAALAEPDEALFEKFIIALDVDSLTGVETIQIYPYGLLRSTAAKSVVKLSQSSDPSN
jgi:hypothetical protein